MIHDYIIPDDRRIKKIYFRLMAVQTMWHCPDGHRHKNERIFRSDLMMRITTLKGIFI